MGTLRSKIIRLAHTQPATRRHLLPLLRGKQAAKPLEMRLSREILRQINKAAAPVLTKYDGIPLVDQYLEGVIPFHELVQGLVRSSLFLSSPDRFIELHEDGMITDREFSEGLMGFEHIPSVRQYLEGVIPIQDLKRALKMGR